MSGLDRRNFLLTALGGMGGLGLASCIDLPSHPSSRNEEMVLAYLDAEGIHLRQDIYCLNELSSDLIAYRAGVAVMKSRPETDPTSWAAQRAIHATFLARAGMISNQCQHGTIFFFSWHRMYLYWFERIVRAASGVPSFALPYWGYSPTGRRDLPEPFRWPPDPVNNSLFVAERNPHVNAGVPLSAGATDSGTAMQHTSFYPFQTSLEGTPHGTVHTGVGGYMTLVPTSALDPIFYVHHSNIDRLWEVWLAMGPPRANPTDAPWRNTVFNFYNENRAVVSMTGDQIVSTAQQLAYRYVECAGTALDAAEPTLVAPLEGEAARLFASISRRPTRGTVQTLADQQVALRLSAQPVEVRVPLPAGTGDVLRAFEDGTLGNDLVVHLQGLVLLQEAKVYYEVYANLGSAAKDTAYTRPEFVGNLDFFGVPTQSGTLHAGHGGTARRLSLLRVYAFLRSRGLWNDQELRLTFVPRGYTEGSNPQSLLTSDQAYVDRLTVELR